ncbi:MAG: AbrB/MazE/SpoVT family DNA-binding domain-containing protein [Chloroflexota bacterium]|nr:AbrB/MazE/SpoVT family DNA-binding domain-containing protein [Chloroflexota bacterium]
MRTKVQKWGNSLALRIPKPFALDAQLENNSVVEISLIDGRIEIKPVSTHHLSLKKLLSGVTSDNLHQEIHTGVIVGNEAW